MTFDVQLIVQASSLAYDQGLAPHMEYTPDTHVSLLRTQRSSTGLVAAANA
jgi:hypothetical protein